MANSGTKLYLGTYDDIDGNYSSILEYTLSTPYDTSTASYVGNNTTNYETILGYAVESLALSTDGSKIFGLRGNVLKMATLPTPFSIATLVNSGVSYNFSPQLANASRMTFSPNGLHLYVATAYGTGVGSIFQYDLSTPFDISTIAYSGKSLDITSKISYPHAIAFSLNGNTMFVLGNGDATVYTYNLGASFDISTAVFAHSALVNATGAPMMMVISGDNSKLLCSLNSRIVEYQTSQTSSTYTWEALSACPSLTALILSKNQFTVNGSGIPQETSFPKGTTAINDTDPQNPIFFRWNGTSWVDVTAINDTTYTGATQVIKNAIDINYSNTTSLLTATNVQKAIDEVDANVDDILTSIGTTAGQLDLGAFTGSIIPDNSTVKQALQTLETAHENLEIVITTTSLNPQVYQGTSFVVAQANLEANVADVILLSDGSRISNGLVKYIAHGFTIGNYYYLSQTVPAGVTDVVYTSGLVQRLFFVVDADTLLIDILQVVSPDTAPTFTQTVYVDDVSPNTATIFDVNNPPTIHDTGLMANSTNLYIGNDGSTWTYNTATLAYTTYVADANTPFYLANTVTDAGGNKTTAIGRTGSLGVGTTNPTAKLEVNSGTTNTSGLKLTNLKSTSTTTAANGKVLSVNTTGDVILTDAPSGAGVYFGVATNPNVTPPTTNPDEGFEYFETTNGLATGTINTSWIYDKETTTWVARPAYLQATPIVKLYSAAYSGGNAKWIAIGLKP